MTMVTVLDKLRPCASNAKLQKQGGIPVTNQNKQKPTLQQKTKTNKHQTASPRSETVKLPLSDVDPALYFSSFFCLDAAWLNGSLSGRSPFCQRKLSEKSQIYWKSFSKQSNKSENLTEDTN